MTLKEESVLDDNNCTRPISSTTIIVDESIDNLYGQQQDINAKSTEGTESAIPIDITKSVSEDEKHLVKEAGQGGAVLGLLVGGPVGSALLGFGSAYAIRKPKDCTIGKTARSLGELTMSVKEKAYAVEEKHHFVERSKTSIDKFCGCDSNSDNNNDKDKNDNDNDNKNNEKSSSPSNIAFKTRSLVVSGWDAASRYTKENQLIERGVEGTGKGIEYVGDAISSLRWGRSNNNNKKSPTVSTTDNDNDKNDDNDDDDDTTIVSSSNEKDDDVVVREAVVVGEINNDKESKNNNDDEYTKLVTATTN